MAKKGTGASAAIILAQLSWNIPDYAAESVMVLCDINTIFFQTASLPLTQLQYRPSEKEVRLK